jgi:hypothetical protein
MRLNLIFLVAPSPTLGDGAGNRPAAGFDRDMLDPAQLLPLPWWRPSILSRVAEVRDSLPAAFTWTCHASKRSRRLPESLLPRCVVLYNRASYAPEKKAVLQRWADHLEGIVSISPRIMS